MRRHHHAQDQQFSKTSSVHVLMILFAQYMSSDRDSDISVLLSLVSPDPLNGVSGSTTHARSRLSAECQLIGQLLVLPYICVSGRNIMRLWPQDSASDWIDCGYHLSFLRNEVLCPFGNHLVRGPACLLFFTGVFFFPHPIHHRSLCFFAPRQYWLVCDPGGIPHGPTLSPPSVTSELSDPPQRPRNLQLWVLPRRWVRPRLQLGRAKAAPFFFYRGCVLHHPRYTFCGVINGLSIQSCRFPMSCFLSRQAWISANHQHPSPLPLFLSVLFFDILKTVCRRKLRMWLVVMHHFVYSSF